MEGEFEAQTRLAVDRGGRGGDAAVGPESGGLATPGNAVDLRDGASLNRTHGYIADEILEGFGKRTGSGQQYQHCCESDASHGILLAGCEFTLEAWT